MNQHFPDRIGNIRTPDINYDVINKNPVENGRIETGYPGPP